MLMERGTDCLGELRRAYAEALDKEPDKERMFDRLKYVTYEEFNEWGRLRRSCEGLTTPYMPEEAVIEGEEEEKQGRR